MASAPPGLARLLTNLGAGAVARIFSAVLGVVLIVAMTRLGSREEFGDYVIAFSWFQLLQLTPLLGLHFLLARDVAFAVVAPARIVATVGRLALAAAVVLATAFALASMLLYPSPLANALLLVALSLVPTAVISTAEMTLTGQERLGRVALVNVAESAARCAVFVALVTQGLVAIYTGFLVLRVLALAAYLADARLRALIIEGSFERNLLFYYLRRTPVLGGIMLASVAFNRLDVLFLSKLVPAAEVAIYGIAARLYDLSLMASAILLTALLPAASRIGPGQPARLSALCTMVGKYGLLLGLPALAIGGALAPGAVTAVFGAGFADAARLFRILLLAALLTAGNQVLAGVLLIHDLQRADLWCLVLGCLVLASLLLLVPAFGLAAAAVSVVLSAAVQFVVRLVLVQRFTGVAIEAGTLARPLLAGMAMAAAITWQGAGWSPTTLPVGLVVYGAAAFLLGSIGRRTAAGDMAQLRAILTIEPQ